MYGAPEMAKLFFFLLKRGLGKAARDEMASASAQYIAEAMEERGVQLDPRLDANAQTAVTALRDTGFAPIGDVFSDAEITDIHTYLADKPVTFRKTTAETEKAREARLEEVPENTSLVRYKLDDLCRCPLIYKVLHDERLINLAGIYLGAPPSIATIATWWSFPDNSQPYRSQPFHHDRDDFSILKLFVYLTDVTPLTGPHAYLLKTHTTALLEQDMQHLDRESATIFWAWMNKQMKPDDEILRVFDMDRLKVPLGPRGTSFLEDTRGLHRAVHPREGSRLAFEVTYTVLPKYNEVHTRIPRQDLSFPGARKDIDALTRYATRLLYY